MPASTRDKIATVLMLAVLGLAMTVLVLLTDTEPAHDGGGNQRKDVSIPVCCTVLASGRLA